MRIKAVPEDFRVVEVLAVPLEGCGPYAVYRVQKRNLTTLEVQAALAQRLGLAPSAVQFPALKDKVAVAIQHGTVRVAQRAMPEHIEGRGFTAQRLGFLPHPLSTRDLEKNVFTVTLRDIPRSDVDTIREKFEVISGDGFPNYFDMQRFGSWSSRLGFPGKHLLLGRWEEVLRAYLAEPLRGDPPPVRRFKRVAREHWGNWQHLKGQAPRGNLRSVLTFLCDHPQDHKRAVNLITPRILSLWLSAYQSFLWNKMASRVLRDLAGGVQALTAMVFPWGEGAVPAYPLDPGLRAKLLTIGIPLPSAKTLPRCRSEEPLPQEAESVSTAMAAVLAEEGLAQGDLKARGLHRAYLGSGRRALWVVPAAPEIAEPEADELFPGHFKLVFSFALPPGSYATLLLRLLSESLANEKTAG